MTLEQRSTKETIGKPEKVGSKRGSDCLSVLTQVLPTDSELADPLAKVVPLSRALHSRRDDETGLQIREAMKIELL
ncbi:hypothetical protein DICSQDRAFT_136416 [Dichomitus squalens LYAD-421 SS1]|uniref:Uncharacterized protein n=1 Tax=Dichomitus squalens (strain LYAD-421) TaxID=732165 RepID=R7T2F7_DICSQ|nr:uncharacterized protein DICSQDRAFT_136416 [Dichomitus squalens LYAD-421 SS1]EJF61527.1 hypothetical protein DICSQDRAFT_136416 [Dichomitus squalens LYAD-421 SS1]